MNDEQLCAAVITEIDRLGATTRYERGRRVYGIEVEVHDGVLHARDSQERGAYDAPRALEALRAARPIATEHSDADGFAAAWQALAALESR